MHRASWIGKALIAAYNAKTDLGKALESVLGWEQFVTTVEEAERLVEPFDCDFLDEMRNQYPQIRQYSPALLSTFDFRVDTCLESRYSDRTLARTWHRMRWMHFEAACFL